MLPASTIASPAPAARRPVRRTASGRFFAPGRDNRQQTQRFSRRSRRGTESLDYMHARFYNPQTGRFLSVDPIHSMSPQGPQGWNKYTYVENSPLKNRDPDGKALETIVDVISIGFDVAELIREPSLKNAGILAADVALTAAPFVPTIGSVKLVGKAADATRMAHVREVGAAGEAAVRKAFDIGAQKRFDVPGGGRYRVADGFNPQLKELSEVKNSGKVNFTSQIRDFVSIAKANDANFVLYVRADAKLSKRLQEAVSRGDVELRFIPE